ncbi:MAG: TasA family protein [Candidatus Pacebacteria bacterium]|nr:TasA family protein [Candidatus Paceibacterota bacterium]MDR3583347.1 TasA family protein [Candidatus Paceibacterota bacterium]
MKTIIKSLVLVMAVAAVAGGATYAYFSASATSTGNTFSTGTLKISIDGNDCTHHNPGFFGGVMYNHDWDDCHGSAKIDVNNAQPGNCETGKITVKNTGSLTARDLTIAPSKDNGALCDALNITTDNSLSGVTIAPDKSQDVSVRVCLPNDGTDQSTLQGKTCSFSLNVGAKAYDNDNTGTH